MSDAIVKGDVYFIHHRDLHGDYEIVAVRQRLNVALIRDCRMKCRRISIEALFILHAFDRARQVRAAPGTCRSKLGTSVLCAEITKGPYSDPIAALPTVELDRLFMLRKRYAKAVTLLFYRALWDKVRPLGIGNVQHFLYVAREEAAKLFLHELWWCPSQSTFYRSLKKRNTERDYPPALMHFVEETLPMDLAHPLRSKNLGDENLFGNEVLLDDDCDYVVETRKPQPHQP